MTPRGQSVRGLEASAAACESRRRRLSGSRGECCGRLHNTGGLPRENVANNAACCDFQMALPAAVSWNTSGPATSYVEVISTIGTSGMACGTAASGASICWNSNRYYALKAGGSMPNGVLSSAKTRSRSTSIKARRCPIVNEDERCHELGCCRENSVASRPPYEWPTSTTLWPRASVLRLLEPSLRPTWLPRATARQSSIRYVFSRGDTAGPLIDDQSGADCLDS